MHVNLLYMNMLVIDWTQCIVLLVLQRPCQFVVILSLQWYFKKNTMFVLCLYTT